MTSDTEVNFATICRACMANADTLLAVGSPLDVDENTPITDVIEELTAVQVRTGDGLPDSICERCVQELRRFVEFIRQVRLTDRSLRQMFKESRGGQRKKMPLLEIQKVELDEDNGVEEYLEYEEVIWKDAEKDHHEELIFELKMESGSDGEFQGFEETLEETKSVERVSQMRPVTGRGKARSGQRKKRSRNSNVSIEAGANDELDEIERKMFQVLERQEGQLLCCGCYQIFDTEEELADHSAAHASKATINVQKSVNTVRRRSGLRLGLIYTCEHTPERNRTLADIAIRRSRITPTGIVTRWDIPESNRTSARTVIKPSSLAVFSMTTNPPFTPLLSPTPATSAWPHSTTKNCSASTDRCILSKLLKLVLLL